MPRSSHRTASIGVLLGCALLFIAAGLRADLVELDGGLQVRRVMRGGTWFEAGSSTGGPTSRDDPAGADPAGSR